MIAMPGDIYIVKNEYQPGVIMKKTRPMIVLSNAQFNEHAKMLHVAPITTTPKDAFWAPYKVNVPLDGATRAIMVDQTRLVNASDLLEFRGRASNDVLHKCRNKLAMLYNIKMSNRGGVSTLEKQKAKRQMILDEKKLYEEVEV
jgi:mRNA-degrading endonuclease toxin of MazEF toxin-antitoxin module